MLRVQLLQTFSRHMSINLGSGDIGVPEQHLHHAQISAVIEQVCSEGMTKSMR